MAEINVPYWLEVPLVKGSTAKTPERAGIVVIGSGFTGSSLGYFLQKKGFEDILIVDYKPEQAATFRNCGHILYGTVESMKAFSEIHGVEKARELWAHSIGLCNRVEETIKELKMDADYRRDGYLVVSINEAEDRECRESVKLLNSFDFESEYYDANQVRQLGFRNCYGARYERGSAQAHPTKFRNGLMETFLKNGGQYYSNIKVIGVEEKGSNIEIRTETGVILADAVVIAANAYSPIFSEFIKSRGLIEPFRGQILTSKPLKHDFKVRYPHSFDHGYEYALITEDNRLMIGGWRNNSPTKELGTYSLEPNSFISQGLKDFVDRHYTIQENIEWQYVWTGIMGASLTSLPFVGPTNSDRVFVCAGYTGHGFSWGHGSASLLADIMAGESVPEVAKYFSPRHRH
jgi:gamma-glutamylputrescine oxidase